MLDLELMPHGTKNIHCIGRQAVLDENLIGKPLMMKPGRVDRFLDIKIEIHNLGKSAVEFESVQLRKEKVLAPGAESFVVIAPLSPGEYKFFDDFHQQAQGVIVAK